MPKSHDERLFALRPADDRPETVAASLEAMRGFASDAVDRAAGLRAARQDGLMIMPAADLIRLDNEAIALEAAAAQAGELIGLLEVKHHRSMADAARAELTERRALLAGVRDEFARKFHAAYADFATWFMAAIEEGQALHRQTVVMNQTAKQFNTKCSATYGETYEPVELLPPTPICKAYFERVVLPKPNLDHIDARWTPLAVAGQHWTAVAPEGSPPAALAAMQAKFAANDAQRRANRADNDRIQQESRHEFETQNRRTAEREAQYRRAELVDGSITVEGRRHFLDQPKPQAAAPTTPAAPASRLPPARPQRPAPPIEPAGDAPQRDRFGTAPMMATPDAAD